MYISIFDNKDVTIISNTVYTSIHVLVCDLRTKQKQNSSMPKHYMKRTTTVQAI